MTIEPTDAEKLICVLKLAFNNDRSMFDRFCEIIHRSVPEAQAAVLRGSAITGIRFVDGAPFDAEGPGTSDLDLTLVGAEVLRYYSAFWIPGMHSKPLSDDDPDIAEAMKIILENKGYEVLNALDSAEGMNRLKEARPDLIILDVMMRTSQEGFELARELKHDVQYRDIPILMLTAVGQKTGLDFKSAAGDESWLPVEGFLDKPIKPDVLLEKIADLLDEP